MSEPTPNVPDPQDSPADSAERAMQGHTYDGIREYDNPMPGWWVAIFWAGILFAPVYMLGIHVFGFIDTYEDDFVEAGTKLEAVRTAYEATGPSFKTDEGALEEHAANTEMALAGELVYGTTCAACHGDLGQGTIGPNLTDEFWIHGGTPSAIYQVIAEGVATAGMPAWKEQLSEEQMAQAMAFVVSLQGTTPPNPKEPQGEPAAGI